MGNFGSSVGLKTAEKISANTFAAIEKLKIGESTQNLTETIERIVHPPGPIDFHVQIDFADNLVHLAETFFVIAAGILIIGFILMVACWRVAVSSDGIKI